MTTTCAECQEGRAQLTHYGWRVERPLPRSEPHELDARALKARLEDRERLIAAFRERCQKLEAVADAARNVLSEEAVRDDLACFNQGMALLDALAALDAKEGG